MKKILAFTLLLLCLLSALVSCRGVESEEGIVGVWRSEELSTNEKISQRMIYAFAPNGHMLSIDVYADQITSVVGAHYAYDEAGVLSITQSSVQMPVGPAPMMRTVSSAVISEIFAAQ